MDVTENGAIKLRCTQFSSEKYDDTSDRLCLYQTVELKISPFASVDKVTRNQLGDFLIEIANRNCKNFIARAFAHRAGLDTSRNILKDVATGLAAGTAKTNPAISVGLGVANLFTGSVVDNINATYYLRESFPGMKAAIEASRTRQLTMIYERRSAPVDYPLWASLTDIGRYADLCSVDAAISEITESLNARKKEEETKKAEALSVKSAVQTP